MHKIFLYFLFLTVGLAATAQENKLYYDESWQECSKRDAMWYRIYTTENGLYNIEDHYADGTLYMTGYRTNIASNQVKYREGAIVFYDRQGHKVREGEYKNGMRVGLWKYYYKNSNAVKSELRYKDGKLETTHEFDSATYTLIDYGKDTATNDNKRQYVYTEQMPRSIIDIGKYLGKNMTYPKLGRKAKIEGKVIVRFIVDEDGAIAEPKITTGLGGEFDDEALRVVSEMPNWIPGYQNGYAVRVYFTLPINFKL